MRYDPYGGRSFGESVRFGPPFAAMAMSRQATSFGRIPMVRTPFPREPAPVQPAASDSFARDLLKLYAQDPVAFDHYAKNPLVRKEFQIDDPIGDAEPAEALVGEVVASSYSEIRMPARFVLT